MTTETRTTSSAGQDDSKQLVDVVVEAYGYTFRQWLDATGRLDSASEYDLRAAWRAGESPEDYAD